MIYTKERGRNFLGKKEMKTLSNVKNIYNDYNIVSFI